jgi:hypothetical protein
MVALGCRPWLRRTGQGHRHRQPRTLVWRELRKRIDLVELAVVSRAGGEDPLIDHFIAFARTAG